MVLLDTSGTDGPLFVVAFVFLYAGPIFSIFLSVWRLKQRDYVPSHREASLANMTPALDFFYSLVVCQGVIYYLLVGLAQCDRFPISMIDKKCKFPKKWGKKSAAKYLEDIQEKYTLDPELFGRSSLLRYAIGLLESDWRKDYFSGARILDMLIKNGEDAGRIILPSRAKIHGLLHTLGQRSDDIAKIRQPVARIVAHIAGGIQLAQFPGAIQSVSSLLQTTGQPYWNNNQDELSPAERRNLERASKRREEEKQLTKRTTRKKPETGAPGPGAGDGGNANGGGVQQKKINTTREEDLSEEGQYCNELILQGLRILERLACDPHNCMIICSDPGLLAKITAPLYSETLIQDISISEPWADITNESLRAMHRLILNVAPGSTGLRHQVFSNKQAVRNLQSILDLDGSEELQMRAMEILTELVLDSVPFSFTSTSENLVKKQLKIFVGDGGEEQVQAATNNIEKKTTLPIEKKTTKATAGETLSILFKTKDVSNYIVTTHHGIADRLTAMLCSKEKIRYRIISAEILENLCKHCKEHVKKETLLPKFLGEILTIKTKLEKEAPERTTSAPGGNKEIRKNSSQPDDLEKQCMKQNGQRTHDKVSDQQAANEDEADMKGMQEALLSLTLVIRDILVDAESFALAVQEISPGGGGGAFLEKLTDIIDDNCWETPISLRIVKLCGQIGGSIMGSNSCTSEQKREFVESLSLASKTMAKLESCMLFAGTDCGLEKTARPLLSNLLSDVEKELEELPA